MTYLDEITALTVGYNSQAVLPTSLAPIYGHMKIVVVDNASADGSVSMLEKDFSDVTIVKNDKNLGYGAGFNSGLAKIKTKYLLAFSPDSVFTLNQLRQLHQFAELYDNAAMTSPSLDVPNHGKEIWVMGPGEMNHRRASFLADGPFCSWFSSGAVCIYRTDMLNAIGGFDENIFLYNEDLDLCIRLTRAGYSIINVPNIVATHLNSGSAPPSAKLHWRKDWNFAWGRLYVTNKFSGKPTMLRLALRIIILRSLKSMFYAVTFDKKRFIRDFSTTLGALAFLLNKRPNPKS